MCKAGVEQDNSECIIVANMTVRERGGLKGFCTLDGRIQVHISVQRIGEHLVAYSLIF